MSDIFEIKEDEERLILAAVCVNKNDDTKQSLVELKELAQTAGALTVATVIQNLDAPVAATYLGKGKMEEIRLLAQQLDATTLVCDDELSPVQLKNLEDAVGIKVIDRTILILDIFAQRAVTKEGKLQVELAQLRYRATRLVGLGKSLSRLGGGIGTRGPGEKKLEMDKRLIKDRISQLKSELANVESQRKTNRVLRTNNEVPVVAIVGYTNAGKSTLLNKLTGAGVLEQDQLFATLDPTTRKYKLESGQEVLLTDTVGFIRKLPHHLVEAFKSTLEEAKYADIILHVVDSSNEDFHMQMHVVYDTLRQLKVEDKTVITAFNKVDRLENDEVLKDLRADETIKISAKSGTNLDELMKLIEEVLRKQKTLIEKVFPYAQAGRIQQIRKYGQLLIEEYRQEGIFVKAYVPNKLYNEWF
ncbi:MAG: GTPase HflX [Lachnospiraceae bacterium]|nr:GTPase HflX [Lachnospiraceae bacterium]